ncbi:isopeptide-forming domain-containing fimbrial protein [Pseudoclavibacter sp. 13-3]|uniref:isopeptide-forming domain-containing fimbrial protein n=1 Tax=Pseudoclavibacter sp. 13-3 TaxID=2901228 RepID=UPI001E2A324E|nr:isopeptide-forming domain-containing fimbrial protein [Pseudoclavibacter sp. 13-3]MCD7101404.1 DUF11 domain-containing protein [Pseudoclavibacter sp. 13-3]
MPAYLDTRDRLPKRGSDDAPADASTEQPWYRRPIAMLMALLIAMAGFSSLPQFAADAHADGTAEVLEVDKSGPASASADDTVTYRVTIKNPATSTSNAYNVSLLDTLPAGASYVAGSTTVDYPYSFGDPAQIAVTHTEGSTTSATGQHVLVWHNELDLVPGQSISFEYRVKFDQGITGSLKNTAQAYSNSDPRVVAQLTSASTVDEDAISSVLGSGDQPKPDQSSPEDSVTTTISDLIFLKDKSSPLDTAPADWLRGVHDNKRTIPLTLQNNSTADVTRTVVDYLPAAFEFLGATDNSTSTNSPSGAPEWTDGTDGTAESADTTGAASAVGPKPGTTGTSSGALKSVETVTLADGEVPGVAAGVYTKSTWQVTVPAGQTAQISYTAGIPLKENAPWPADSAPSATSLEQASNLDNNTGANTRDLVGSQVTNTAQVLSEDDSTVDIADSKQYTIQDVVADKTVVDAQGNPVAATQQRIGNRPAYDFSPGSVTYFTLTTSLSEYVAGQGITVTDTLGDGMQPIPTAADDVVAQAVAGSPVDSDNKYSGTLPLGSSPAGAAYAGATLNSDGTYSVSFNFPGAPAADTLNTLARGGKVSITIPVYLQTTYTSDPTQQVVSYDLFTNAVESKVTTIPGVEQETPGTPDLSGGASVDLRAVTPTIKKGILPRAETEAFTAAELQYTETPDQQGHNEGTMGDPSNKGFLYNTDSTAADSTFQRGDIVWFHVHMQIQDPKLQLRGTTVRDYLPAGVELVGWDFSHHNNAGGKSVWDFDQNGSVLSWTANDNYQSLGDDPAEFALNIAVRVTDAPAAGGSVTVKDNLAKASITNNSGQVVTFRDRVSFWVEPDAKVALDKSIVGIGSAGTVGQNPLPDGSQVKSGQTVTYKIAVTNTNSYAISDPEIWDVLPAEFVAGSAKLYSDEALSNQITDALDEPNKTLKWTHNGTMAAGATATYYVTQQVADNPEVNKLFTNTAGVRHFTTILDQNTSSPTTWDWYPAQNIDTSIQSGGAIEPNAPRADDSANVRAENVVLNKQVTSGLGQAQNNWSRTGQSDLAQGVYGDSAQAVVGERVDYRITLEIPAHSTITGARLNDALERGTDPQVVLNTSSPAASWANADGPLSSGVPSVTFSEKTANGFTSAIADWTNTSDQTVTLTVAFSGVVSADAAVTTAPTFADASASLRDRNYASFSSQANTTALIDTADVDIVQPKISVGKTASRAGTVLSDGSRVNADDVIDYKVTATADGSRPGLKTPSLNDALPAGLIWQGLGDVQLNGTTVTAASVQSSFTVDGVAATLNVGDVIPANTVLTVAVNDPALNTAGIQPGKSYVVNYQAKLPNPIGAAKVFTNTATVQGDSLSAQEATDQNGGQVNQTYAKQASKDITAVGFTTVKTREDGALTYGQQQVYTIESQLPANTTGYNVTVGDTLPQGITFAGTTSVQTSDDGGQSWTTLEDPQGVQAAVDGQNVTWVLAGDQNNKVTSGATDRQIRVVFVADVTGKGSDGTTYIEPGSTISNVASIGWNDSNRPDSTAFDHGSTSEPATFTVLGPKLTPEKSVVKVNGSTPSLDEGKAKVNPADWATYRVTLTNWAGGNASTAYDVNAADALPANIDAASVKDITASGTTGVVDAQAVRNDGTIAISAAQIPVGGVVTVEYTAQLISSDQLDPASTTWDADNTNTVTIDHSASQPKTDGEYPTGTREYAGGSDTAQITPVFPHVELQKSPDSGTATRGGAYEWTISATNNGAGVAKNVKLVDDLPDNWRFTATSSVTKASGANSASLAASTSGPAAGDTGKVSWRDAGQDGWTLQPGEKITVVYTATPNDGTVPDTTKAATGEHTNTVGVELTDGSGAKSNGAAPTNSGSISDQGDSSYAGTDAQAKAYIAEADLSVDKTGLHKADQASGPIYAGSGQQSAWDIEVANNGPDAAVGPFTITDTTEVPDGVTVTGIAPESITAGWSVDGAPVKNAEGKWVAKYTYGGTGVTLETGATLPKLTILVTADADAAIDPVNGSTGTDTAQLSSPTLDDHPENNSSTDTVDFAALADLALAKSVTTAPADIGAGKPLTWQLKATNNGQASSLGTAEKPITVTDTVPTGVQDVTVGTLPAGWALAAGSKGSNEHKAQAGDTITVQFVGKLSVNQSAEITLNSTVLPTYLDGTIENSATVTPGATTEPSDPGASNNTGEADVTIDPTNNGTTLSIDKHRVVKGADGTWFIPTDQQKIIAGQDVSYLITVSNQGSADAKNVTSRDVLPDGLTYKSIDSAAGTWSVVSTGGQTVSVKLTSGDPAGQLAAGASAAYVITASTSPSITSDVVNWAYAKGDNTNEPQDSDNGGPVRSVDLGIEKSFTDATAVPTAGKDLGYTLTITNHGSSDTSGPITVTDALPAQLAYVAGSARVVLPGQSAQALEPTSSPADGKTKLTWQIGDESLHLAVGQTITVTLTTHVAQDAAAGKLVNVATVDGPDSDPNPSNNTSEKETPITTSTDVLIDKTVAAGPWIAGTDVKYNVTLTVKGPSLARNVTLSDVLPAGLTPVSIGTDGDGWTWDQMTATGARDSLAPGIYSIPVTAHIEQGVATGTDLVNTATTTWTDTDPNTPNTKSDDEKIVVTTDGDLQLTKTAVDENGHEVSSATAGTALRYRLDVSNNGPSQVVAPVRISDTLPAGMTFDKIVSGEGWSVAEGSTATAPKFEYAGALATGAKAPALVIEVSLSADVYATSGAQHALVNTATTSSDTPDSEPANNTDTATVDVTEQADLGVTKTHDASAVHIGDTLPFTITTTNYGPSTARGVTITEKLPKGLTYVGLQAGQESDQSEPAWRQLGEPTINADGTTTVAFALLTGEGNLASGASAPVLKLDTTVTAEAYPDIVNGVDVSSDTPEPTIEPGQDDPHPNHADDPIVVPPLSTLIVTKQHQGEFKIGENGTYVITLTNNGPTEDPSAIRVVDELPAGLVYRSADQQGVTSAGQTVTWVPKVPLAVGETRTLTLTVSVNEAAGDRLTNTVHVSSDTEQTPDAVLSASDEVEVQPADGLSPLARTGMDFGILIAAFGLLIGGAALVMLRSKEQSHGRRAR